MKKKQEEKWGGSKSEARAEREIWEGVRVREEQNRNGEEKSEGRIEKEMGEGVRVRKEQKGNWVRE